MADQRRAARRRFGGLLPGDVTDGLAILALGCLVDAYALSQLVVGRGRPVVQAFKVGVPVALSVAVFVTYWHCRRSEEVAPLQRRVVVVALAFVAIATGTVVIIGAAGGVVFEDFLFATVMTTAAGAAVGAPAGVHYHEAVVGQRELAAEARRTRRLNQRLQVVNRILRHNVRNNLTVALGRIRLAIEAATTPSVTGHLDTAVGALETLQGHAEKTLELEGLDAASEGVRPVDLAAAVESAATLVEAQHAAVDLTLDLPASATALAHPLVEVAVGELVQNAVEHTPGERASVTVSVDERPSSVVVTVRDRGDGIDDRERAVIESGVETPLQHGSGVGLWFVKWITELSDGEMQIADGDPSGAVVRLTFQRP